MSADLESKTGLSLFYYPVSYPAPRGLTHAACSWKLLSLLATATPLFLTILLDYLVDSSLTSNSYREFPAISSKIAVFQ